MPENSPEASFDNQVEQLEGYLTDPHVEAVLNEARRMNITLNEAETTPGDRSRMIKSLNAAWGFVMAMPVKATGRIETTAGKKYYEDLEVISEGFIIERNPILVDEELVAMRFNVAHRLIAPSEAAEGDSGEERSGDKRGYMYTSAEIDDVTLELPVASAERASGWLREYYPDLLKEIDEKLAKHEGAETDAFLALRDIELPKEMCEDTDFARSCVTAYVDEALKFDALVPYSVEISGRAQINYPNGQIQIGDIPDSVELVFLRGVMIERYGSDDDNAYELFALVEITGADRSLAVREVRLPLQSFKSATSMRDSHYNT